ncbi:MAG TPA: imidazoleglycerol-phosphate dehydratase HisB, partial [Alphaproteobacteria bacterium]|nr:imidazoleglycerol-phosphate dehydratase HisB [Alphaproteobacteria bacterium]
LAALWNASPDRILLGRGSDEAIDLLIRMFCEAGKDQVLICPPTYGEYKVLTAVQGAELVKVPLNKEWQLDVPAILKACTAKTKLIFFPTPNAPMGHEMKREDILALCKGRAEKSLIVVDEAYIEFTQNPDGMIGDLKDYPNLVILRTMSKAYGLAGERVGGVIGTPELVKQLQKILAPYALSQSGIKVALDALSPSGLTLNMERRRIIAAERERMAKTLPQSPMVTSVFPSTSNFLLVQTKDSQAFMRRLKQFSILARDRHNDIPNTVRLSIGTPEDNNAVLKALDIAVIEPPSKFMPRLFSSRRATKETSIEVTVNLDAPNFLNIDTGIGFFDHMLSQLASHGGFGLDLRCKGDLVIDQHHSIEDCALALGEALKAALGDKRGIARFGFSAPLDEAVANVVIDLSGRPYFVFTGELPAEKVGEMTSEMVPHFFRSLATAMAAAIHVTVQGENTHHMVEASFKAAGRALRQAFAREGIPTAVPSTKGVL